MTRVAISGAAGRMGQRLIALGSQDSGLELVSALERSDHPQLGADAGLAAGIGEIGVPFSDRLSDAVEVVIDFSVPEGARQVLATCRERGLPLVLATTGLEDAGRAELLAAAEEIPVVSAPSMSTAVNLTMKLATIAAEVLREDAQGVDVEIIERHHRYKEDAPSGTALRFGELIAEKMGQTHHQHGRVGRPGARPRQEIGYHALRVGDNPGEHTIVFGMLGESIELTVRSTNRDCYALGALAAAKFIAGRPPGLYGMEDVLGFAER